VTFIAPTRRRFRADTAADDERGDDRPLSLMTDDDEAGKFDFAPEENQGVPRVQRQHRPDGRARKHDERQDFVPISSI